MGAKPAAFSQSILASMALSRVYVGGRVGDRGDAIGNELDGRMGTANERDGNMARGVVMNSLYVSRCEARRGGWQSQFTTGNISF